MKTENEKIPKLKMRRGLPVVNLHAAGIDIGDTEHHIALSDGNHGHMVWTFGCFTSDLYAIVELLKKNGITTVAMEATGVYYVPLYLMIEEAGMEPYLVNAKHVKNVTGRKDDDTDAIWIQKLHACGLLQKCFQPNEEDRTLREFVRHRKNLIVQNADAVRRMQKALECMNLKIHTVISDILGETGMKMMEAILGGERSPQVLSELKNNRIKASAEEIEKSLNGIWKAEYLFMLQQAYDDYKFRLNQIKTCEEKIREQLITKIALVKEGDITDCGQDTKSQKKKPGKNQFNIPIKPLLNVMTGVNLCAIPGIKEVTVLEFISEVGTDMSKWKSAKHFAAWLNLAPNTKKSGGRIISTKMMKKKNKAGQILRMASTPLSNSKSPLGDYYRRIRARLGGKGAGLATAHKLARIIYTMLKEQKEFNETQVYAEQQKFKVIRIKQLEKQLERLKKSA